MSDVSDGPDHARTGGIMPGRVESCQDGSDPCMIHLIKAEPHRSWPQGPAGALAVVHGLNTVSGTESVPGSCLPGYTPA